jgi:uncharacterized phage protein (TIGR02218 family)
MADVIESCGTLSLAITSVSNTTPIVVTTTAAHGLTSTQRVKIFGNSAANGSWQITVTGASTFSLNGSTANGAVSGGTVSRDHSNPVTWRLAVTSTVLANRYILECYNDGPILVNKAGAWLDFDDGNTASGTNYRMMRAFAGHEYNPANGTGVRIMVDTTDVLATGHGVRITEAFFEIHHIGIIMVNLVSATFPTVDATRFAAIFVAGVSQRFFGVTAKFAIGTGDSIACWWFDSGATWYLENCVAIGSGVAGLGATVGFRSAHAQAEYKHCNAYGLMNGVDQVGFLLETSFSAATKLQNCIATACGTACYDLVTNFVAEHCIAGDGSLDIADHPTCIPNVDPEACFINAAYDDFRLLSASPAVDAGMDASVTVDITGLPRSTTSPPEIGAYDGFFDPGEVAEPTEVVAVITTRAELIQWASDTAVHCVGLNVRHVAEIAAAITLNASEELVLSGAVTDPKRTRVIRAQAGLRYVPKYLSGASISGDGTSVIRIQDSYTQVGGGLGVIQTTATASADRSGVIIAAPKGVVLDAIFAGNELGSLHTDRDCIRVQLGDSHRIYNAIARGGTNTAGAFYGIRLMAGVTNTWVFHSVAHRLRHDTGAIGIIDQAPQGSGNRVEACMVALCDVCYDAPFSQAYNVSSDATAIGVGAIINASQTTQFRGSANGDYRLEQNSPGIDSAPRLGVLTDYLGVDRIGANERGAYNGFVFAELFAAPAIETHRRARCYSVIRPDGVARFVTDHDAPVPFRGNTYTPVGGFNRTASESVIGTNVSEIQIGGPINDSVMSALDLLAGFWDSAVLTEYEVDTRYPWKKEFRRKTWLVDSFTFDDEAVEIKLVSRAAQFQDQVLGVHSRTCTYRVFSNDPARGDVCLLLRSLHETLGVGIDSIADDRLVFNADSTLPAQTDGWYDLGEWVWTTGANVGHVSEIKTYVAATRTIELQLKTPFPITTSDLGNVVPGCNGTWDRCGELGNQINFGGDRFPPSSDEEIRNPKG